MMREMRALSLAYTMQEAAELLRISRRALQELIKRHAFYYVNGKRKLFEESDILRLRGAMRREAIRRRTTLSGELTSDGMWIEAQKRLSELRQQNS